jgi:hypothetical protein
MPLFQNTAIGTGNALSASLTYDPFQPGVIGATTESADEAAQESTLAVGDALIIRTVGRDYTAGTNVAVTNVTAANNDYIPLAADGAGMTVDITVTDGRVTSAVVNTAPTTAYDSGMQVTVNGNTVGQADCVLMIPFQPQG